MALNETLGYVAISLGTKKKFFDCFDVLAVRITSRGECAAIDSWFEDWPIQMGENIVAAGP